MKYFWDGFFKQAKENTESVLDQWIRADKEEEEKIKRKDKRIKVDPRALSEAPGTEVWYSKHWF